jgi:redox-sensitive bicupin YhaK (pirin superfamily)
MPDSESRRDFVKKVALGGLSLAAPALAGKAERGPSVLGVKPLGFPWETVDPFLFCVHHEDFYPAGNAAMGPAGSLAGRDIGQDFEGRDGWRMYHGQKVPGFPEHPHRGFETVTVVRRGLVDHSDSLGAAGRYGGGDVQWMTAGAGIQHAEMFPLRRRDGDNTLELFQIWLNLPKARKLARPHFRMLWREDIPVMRFRDPAGKRIEATVIAGELDGKRAPAPPPDSWAADPAHHVAIWTLKLEASATWVLPPSRPGIHRTLYCFQGGTKADGISLPERNAARLRGDAAVRLENGARESGLLLLQGMPIGEPVVQHGPFVMNSEAEIQQAFEDYRRTRFGGWPWKDGEPVHPRAKGRFARHADGREENRPA